MARSGSYDAFLQLVSDAYKNLSKLVDKVKGSDKQLANQSIDSLFRYILLAYATRFVADVSRSLQQSSSVLSKQIIGSLRNILPAPLLNKWFPTLYADAYNLCGLLKKLDKIRDKKETLRSFLERKDTRLATVFSIADRICVLSDVLNAKQSAVLELRNTSNNNSIQELIKIVKNLFKDIIPRLGDVSIEIVPEAYVVDLTKVRQHLKSFRRAIRDQKIRRKIDAILDAKSLSLIDLVTRLNGINLVQKQPSFRTQARDLAQRLESSVKDLLKLLRSGTLEINLLQSKLDELSSYAMQFASLTGITLEAPLDLLSIQSKLVELGLTSFALANQSIVSNWVRYLKRSLGPVLLRSINASDKIANIMRFIAENITLASAMSDYYVDVPPDVAEDISTIGNILNLMHYLYAVPELHAPISGGRAKLHQLYSFIKFFVNFVKKRFGIDLVELPDLSELQGSICKELSDLDDLAGAFASKLERIGTEIGDLWVFFTSDIVESLQANNSAFSQLINELQTYGNTMLSLQEIKGTIEKCIEEYDEGAKDCPTDQEPEVYKRCIEQHKKRHCWTEEVTSNCVHIIDRDHLRDTQYYDKELLNQCINAGIMFFNIAAQVVKEIIHSFSSIIVSVIPHLPEQKINDLVSDENAIYKLFDIIMNMVHCDATSYRNLTKLFGMLDNLYSYLQKRERLLTRWLEEIKNLEQSEGGNEEAS